MASHSDEEVFDGFLQPRPQEDEHSSGIRRLRRASLLAASILFVYVVSQWGGRAGSVAQVVPEEARRFEQKAAAAGASGRTWHVGEVAVEPSQAWERYEKRQWLLVERDLKTLMYVHMSQGETHYQEHLASRGDAETCSKQAGRLFDALAEQSAMEKELEQRELVAFRNRFASALRRRCKDIISERQWLEVAGEELERQKPVITAAVAASLNSAGLGFTAKMHDMFVHESVESIQSRFGYGPNPPGQKDVLKRDASRRYAAELPAAFRAELKWPKCREQILRIHNQGHCGSCWAFGGVASIDARMCIASDGQWAAADNVLSRLHVTSCAPSLHQMGRDGCQGGFPHWASELMARSGVVSGSCLPYYINGEGTEHFHVHFPGPPCVTHCQGGYSSPMINDTYKSAGIANYDWFTSVHGDPIKVQAMKSAIYQEGPISFAFKANGPFMGYTSGVFSVCNGHDQANHAVYTFGWGLAAAADGGGSVEYFEASNSWGPKWGANGHFRIHPRCMTDATIPGTIERTVVSHNVGRVDPSVPKDPNNEYWPWLEPDECPSGDGCVTDLGGAGNYTNGEKCASKALNGKAIRVVEFDTELGYDILEVNGRSFSGSDAGGLNGIVVDEHGILFQSDSSVRMTGFKLCEQQ